MRNNAVLFVSLIILSSCKNTGSEIVTLKDSLADFTHYVNPFIGTSKMGHVFPGATAPFGMVQLSPQTNFEVMFHDDGSYNAETYEYCAGYQYSDSVIIGFAHTNLSGTGHADLGDFLVMPTTGNLVLDPFKTSEGNNGFYSTFSHGNEEASPGYYKVNLDSYKIIAELTASERVGFHQYTFPKS
ncbi:MAG: glycoside hydrolase family 92 protein, partial [Bacteroidetes bacterium]|nr:glycoside hydrolase family 92 protein [Bacteroidota bacterium]